MEEFLKDQPAFEQHVQQEAARRILPAPVVDAATWLVTEPPPVDPILVDTYDTGDKVCVIGASKTRKSFFVLQKALCLAAGMDFLAWKVPAPRRVLLVQLEIQERHYWRRVRRMVSALGISPEAIGDRLRVVNGRGKGVTLEHLQQYAEETRAEVVVVDPLYKFYRGDENSAEAMAAVLAWFDILAQATGAAVVYVHHDPKGMPGDRETRDRGSGSNVLSRDYDACVTLTEHRDQENASVIRVLLRNYAPQAGFSVMWADGCFRVAYDIEAVHATSKSQAERQQRGPGLQDLARAVQQDILTKPWRMDELKAEIQGRFRVGRIRAEDVCRLVAQSEGVEVAKTATFPARVLIGPPKVTEREAARLTREWQTRELS
jgi:RecA-family ATPase